MQKVEKQYLDKSLSLETGKIARQAHGAVMLRHGDMVILATVVSPAELREGCDFFPLTVDYRERFTAVGKFPGGYIKRESRPTEKEILTMRCVDRPMRPLFPKDYFHEVQIMLQVMSTDATEDPDTMAMFAASAAVTASDIPFAGPIGAVRVSKIDGEMKINASELERKNSEFDFVIAGTRDKVVMIEGEAKQTPEDEVHKAICFGHEQLQPQIDLQEELAKKMGITKREYVPIAPSEAVKAEVAKLKDKVSETLQIPGKHERNSALREIKSTLMEELEKNEMFAEENPMTIDIAYDNLVGECMREMIINTKKRVDGRGCEDIRPINCEVGLFPKTHGSALFTRGETQSIAVATLGTDDDEQRIETLAGDSSKRFMLHYTFPPYSVGEARMLRGPGRREIGHGNLAERSLKFVVPEDFGYTVRVTSDITESNGSSSMASVCGGCLCLMDAGIPIEAPVAGISVGLVSAENEKIMITDILGDEDHFGDMDFKVAGSEKGITGVQVDLKINGLEPEFIADILKRSKEARLKILDIMKETLAGPREELTSLAPCILTTIVPPDKIGAIIGPGGKNIRKIQEETNTHISIDDDGTVKIAGDGKEAAEAGKEMVESLVAEAEIGKIYEGQVVKIMSFGAFVKILPEVDGMVHISEIAEHRIENIEDELHVGDIVKVRVIEKDDRGRVNLTMRKLDEPFDPNSVKSRKPAGRSDRRSDRRHRK